MISFNSIFYVIMSFPLGYACGFFSVKFNHLLVIVLGKLWTSGNAQKRYVLVLGLSTIIFSLVLKFTFLLGMEIVIITSCIFAVLFIIGVKHAMRKFGQYVEILEALIQSLFPQGDMENEQYENLVKDTSRISQEMLEDMALSNKESLLLLFLFFDSVFAVFFMSLIHGKLTFTRFINLKKQDQVNYMNMWASTPLLNTIPVAIKGLVGFSYYTSHYSWKKIRYRGEVLRRSFID